MLICEILSHEARGHVIAPVEGKVSGVSLISL